ncbi:MAG: ABC transporter permease [Acidobacteriaceae bacterium]
MEPEEMLHSEEAQALAEQGQPPMPEEEEMQPLTWEITMARIRYALRTSAPYLGALGLLSTLLAYWLLTEVFKAPLFAKIPGPVAVANEWFSHHPMFGISIYSSVYYRHIWASCWRIIQAFLLATVLGVPLGLFMGWKKVFKDYTFPLFELLRPIPMLAWVPLAILMFPGYEASVIYVTFLGSFFVTTLNTLLGVESIDEAYFRAALCLGSKPRHLFFHVIVPGALPFIFTGLQISMGYAWFCLVAGEMIAGSYGLGYLIWNAYMEFQEPVLIIAMITLGFLGWFSSALIRMLARRLMQWQVREMA